MAIIILCALIFTGNFYVFGSNFYGQLGLEKNTRVPITKHPTLSNVVDISSGGYKTFVRTSSNETFAFGYKGSLTTKFAHQFTPIPVFIDEEDFWRSNIRITSRSKSAKK